MSRRNPPRGTKVTSETPDQANNRLVASLSAADMARLRHSLRRVSLEYGQVLNQPGEPGEHVYFPHSGMVALVIVMKDGRTISTATISRDGVVGGMAGLGLNLTATRAVVQIQGSASRITAADFREAVEASPELRDLLVRSNEVLLGQVQIMAACNALHRI